VVLSVRTCVRLWWPHKPATLD